MRTRSGATEPEGFGRNSLPGQSSTLAGGSWFNGKFMNLFRTPRAQDTTNVSPPTLDGRRSPSNKTEETVSSSVIITFDQCLEDRLFSEASQNLREREELLFGTITKAKGLQRREEEVNSLAEDYAVLKRLILETLQQSLSLGTGTVNTDALTSAVKAIHQEDEQDRLWKQRDGVPPCWRPGGWKELHDEALGSLVKDRMDKPSTPTEGQLVGKSSVMADICSMGRQLLDDLRLVVGVVKMCYPPQTDICGFYIRLYHQAFSARLGKIADFVLEDEDCRYLLCWVNEYYPERVQKLHLGCEMDCTVPGKLLPQELLEPLEEQYLSSRQVELMTYVGRILEGEKQKWNNGEEPTSEDGCYVTHVAYDIIQFIYGIATSAAKVVGDEHKAQRITCKLNPLMKSFKVFQDEVMRLNRANSRAIVKANLASIQQFRDVLEKNAHLFVDDVRTNCLSVLTEMKESAHVYLLLPVHDSLRPQYRKLGTNEWLNKGVFEKLLLSIQAAEEQLQGLKESCRQELVCQFHQAVTVEYVRRLLRGDVKLKDKERQNAAYATVKNDAENLHALFVRMGSDQDWLKEILTKIAEVLKLQDVPAIQMQVASLGSAFPDLSEKHVSALLKLKTNISRADRKVVKETLSDTLRETGVAASRPFFSKVQVK